MKAENFKIFKKWINSNMWTLILQRKKIIIDTHRLFFMINNIILLNYNFFNEIRFMVQQTFNQATCKARKSSKTYATPIRKYNLTLASLPAPRSNQKQTEMRATGKFMVYFFPFIFIFTDLLQFHPIFYFLTPQSHHKLLNSIITQFLLR